MASLVVNSLRGELVLTNFSVADPIKIMAVGDSITDDCEVNGAWRQYLQPLLESNGIPFTFVGRQTSTSAPGFSKTAHEGFCGSVIAPPGVMTSPVHGYPGTDVYLHKIARDALTNITPDVVLVLMGANDIGRGRNPWQVATNDMSALLDIIFSNAPNANVILNKAMTIQSATLLSYANYATNVPIYNAALQAVINQRRVAGQNVFLADMYSVVDYSTMFKADHLHPNTTGLQAIAREWLTRIQGVVIRTNSTTSVLVNGGSVWKYSDAGTDLGTNWICAGYDDSGWSSGPAKLGYGDLTVATTVSYGPVATNKHPTTYFRREFVAPTDVIYTNLVLRLAQAHGSVVWLNGRELWRTNLPAGPIAYTNFATRLVGLYAPFIFNPVNVSASALCPGTNVIAVEVHQFSPYIATCGFDLELIGTGVPSAAPELSIATTTTNVILAWPADISAGFQLFSTTNLAGGTWFSNDAIAQTIGGQSVVTQTIEPPRKFFRLVKP